MPLGTKLGSYCWPIKPFHAHRVRLVGLRTTSQGPLVEKLGRLRVRALLRTVDAWGNVGRTSRILVLRVRR